MPLKTEYTEDDWDDGMLSEDPYWITPKPKFTYQLLIDIFGRDVFSIINSYMVEDTRTHLEYEMYRYILPEIRRYTECMCCRKRMIRRYIDEDEEYRLEDDQSIDRIVVEVDPYCSSCGGGIITYGMNVNRSFRYMYYERNDCNWASWMISKYPRSKFSVWAKGHILKKQKKVT